MSEVKHYCINVRDYAWFDQVLLRLGLSLGTVEILFDKDTRKDWLSRLNNNMAFREHTYLTDAFYISHRTTWAIKEYYSMKDLETLANLFESKQVSREFFRTCVESFFIPALPHELLVLQNILGKEEDGKLSWWGVATYYHHGVQIERIPTVHRLVTGNTLSFYEARKAAAEGLSSQELEVLASEFSFGKDDLPWIRRLVKGYDLETVKQGVALYGTAWNKVSTFCALRNENSDIPFEEILELVEQEHRPATVPSVVKTEARTRIKTRGVATLEQEEPEIATGDQREDERSVNWYPNTSMSQMPVMSGSSYLRLLKSCGWEVLSRTRTTSSHLRLRKGNWTITFNYTHSNSTSRYALFKVFRTFGVPESEVQLIIDVANGKKVREKKEINHS